MKDSPEEEELANKAAELNDKDGPDYFADGGELLKSIREGTMTKLEKAIKVLSDPDMHALFRMDFVCRKAFEKRAP